MKKRFFLAAAALVTIALLGGMAISCKNNPKKKAQQQNEAEAVEQVSLTFADVAGMYDTEDSESRVCLYEDGTATWNMIGSLHWTDFTYIICGNKIYFDVEEVDKDTEPAYIYDPEKKTLTDTDGTVYLFQRTCEVPEPEIEYYDGASNITKKWFQGTWEYMEYNEGDESWELAERGFGAGLLKEYTLMTLEEDTNFYFLKDGVDKFAELTDKDIESIMVIRKGGKYLDGAYEFDCYIPDPRDENSMLRFGISYLNDEEVFVIADCLDRK